MSDNLKSTASTADLELPFNEHSYEDWQNLATKSLRGNTLASIAHTTASGLSISPLYTDRPQAENNLQPDSLKHWDNRLAVLGDNPDQQNTTLLAGLNGGIGSAQIQLDCPEQKTLIQPNMLSSVLNNVQLDILPVSLMAGSRFSQAAQHLENLWSEQNISADKVSGAFNADPIGTLASAGKLSEELDTLLVKMVELAQHATTAFPQVKPVCVNSTCYHNAGASLEQELTSSIATATTYLQSMIDAGMSAQSAVDAISFQLACDADTLANVVKLRTLKVLWHHVTSQFNIEQTALSLVVETSLRMQSHRQPWVNHLRNVSAATAAAMGGAETIIVHPHNRIDGKFIDDNITLGARVARNIAIIVGEESGMTFIHDPMGGSYTIESLTKTLSDNTWAALQKLERDGGLVKALNSGQWQNNIAAIQQQRIARLHDDLDVQVSVNRYTTHKLTAHTENSAQTQMQATTKALQTIRDAAAFEASLKAKS